MTARERAKVLATQIRKARAALGAEHRDNPAQITWFIWHEFYGDQFSFEPLRMQITGPFHALDALPRVHEVERRMRQLDRPRTKEAPPAPLPTPYYATRD